MKYLLPLIAAALLTGCAESPSYLITYEAQLKTGGTVRGTTMQKMPELTEANLARILLKLYENPTVSSNGVVVLAVVKMDR